MSKYKAVTVYDAEKKKNVTRTLKIDNFDSEYDLNKHIEKIKKIQREKNMIYKQQNKMTKYNEKLVSPKEIIKEPTVNYKNINVRNNINNFSLDNNTGTSTVIFGSSKRGKTTLMMRLYDLFYKDDKDNICTLFSGNSHIKNYKGDKKLLISEGFVPKSEKYILMQKYINSNTKNKYHWLNMFDDIIDMKYKTLVNKLILTYRNSYISSIMCLQYGYLLSKMNRANVNNVIIFGCNSDEAIKDLIDTFLKSHFLNMNLKTYKEQYNFFKEITDNYGFFYINNSKGIFTMHRILD